MRSRPFRLGVDLDGVLYPFDEVFARYVEGRLGAEPGSLPRPTTWRFYDEQWGLDDESFAALYRDAVLDGPLFATGEPNRPLATALTGLADRGIELHVVSARLLPSLPAEVVVSRTKAWLATTGVPFTSAHVVPGSKLPTISTLALDAHLDDAPSHLSQVASVCTPIVWRRPWNAHIEHFPSARTGPELAEIVATLEQFPR